MSATYTHEVFDPQTSKVMGKYQSANRARRRADRLDNEYGAYRYRVRPISDSNTQSIINRRES